MNTDGSQSPTILRHKFRIALQLVALLLVLLFVATAMVVIDGLRENIGHADVALVLGNKVEPSGQPSGRLRARLEKTAELYRAGYFSRIIASGGVGKEGYDESIVMRDYLVARGVDSAAIIMDSAGDTTFASAENAKKIADRMGFQSIFVVTQYFHVPRSRLALQKCGFRSVCYAHPAFFEIRDLYSAPREALGYIRYSLRGSTK